MTTRAAGEERGRPPGSMRIETIAVGGPRSVSRQARRVTSIFKTPIGRRASTCSTGRDLDTMRRLAAR
jgi:hypothetical protein